MTGRVVCECGDLGPRCLFCSARLCCEVVAASCDARDHCDQCVHDCRLCVREMTLEATR